MEIRSKLQPIKDRFGGEVDDLVRVAIQYPLAHSSNACVIPGFKNVRQVESNARAAGQPLTTEDAAFISRVLRG